MFEKIRFSETEMLDEYGNEIVVVTPRFPIQGFKDEQKVRSLLRKVTDVTPLFKGCNIIFYKEELNASA